MPRRRSSADGRTATRTPTRRRRYARQYIGEYWRSVVRHYELIGDHLTKMRGYESYKPSRR
jgi:hypothetical protein